MKVSPDLKSLVLQNEDIKEVHFDKNGKHYLNVFSLNKSKEDIEQNKEKSLYGSGVYSHHQLIPGKLNVDKIKEPISIGDKETLIVKTLTREEILKSEEIPDENGLVKVISSMSKTDRLALKALLLSSEEEDETEEDEEPLFIPKGQ